MTAVEVKKQSPGTVPDFFSLHCQKNGEGWCNCVAWWVPTWEGWEKRTKEENLRLREELFEQGEYDGYLLYVDGTPAGWAQCGRRDRLSKLCAQLSLTPDPEVYAITCFVIAPAFRKRGLARQLLSGILEDLRARGVRRVQAYPKRGEHLQDGSVWMGPEALYRGAGFFTVSESERQYLMERSLETP